MESDHSSRLCGRLKKAEQIELSKAKNQCIIHNERYARVPFALELVFGPEDGPLAMSPKKYKFEIYV